MAWLGAGLFSWLGTPIPWTLGPLVTVALLRMRGLGLALPRAARYGGQWIIGIALGLYFTPNVVAELLRHLPQIFVGAAFAVLTGLAGAAYLRRATGVDARTAYFSTPIGGASEMVNLAERQGGRIDQVAAAHALRVLMVVVIVPALFQYSGISQLDMPDTASHPVSAPGLALLGALTLGTALLLGRLGVANPYMLGPLLVAAWLTSQDIALSAMPDAIGHLGQLLIGSALGCRFSPDFLHTAPRFLRAVGLYTLAAMLASALLGLLLARWSGVHAATMVLGTTPGGIAEMCITAKALRLGVPVVTAMHVVRMVVVVLVTGPLFTRLSPRWVSR